MEASAYAVQRHCFVAVDLQNDHIVVCQTEAEKGEQCKYRHTLPSDRLYGHKESGVRGLQDGQSSKL